MTLLVLLIICGVGILIYSFFKEHIYLYELKRREDICCKTLLVSSGKKMHAFTIENSKYVTSSVAYSVGGLYKFILRLSGIFLNNVQVNRYIRNVAIKEALVRIKEQSDPADYIVDVKFEVVSLGVGEVLAHAYGTALFLYKDTLGLFDYPDDFKFKNFTGVKSLILNRLIILITLASIILSSLFYTYFRLAEEVFEKFNTQNEKVLWSFIKGSVLENRVKENDFLDVEDKLQTLVDKIVQVNKTNQSNIKIYLLDNEVPDINIYPYGVITITIGMVESIKSENALVFLIAHEIAHYINNDLLAHQHTDIINEYLASELLTEGSVFGGLVVNSSDFNSIEFTNQEEEKADRFAVNAMQLIYGHLGGLQEAVSYYTTLSQNYQNSHKYTEQELDTLNKYIRSSDFSINEVTPLNIMPVNKRDIIKNALQTSDINAPSMVDDFSDQSSLLLDEYNKFLSGLSNIMVLPDNISKEDLESRLGKLDKGMDQIREFQTRFYELIARFDQRNNDEVLKELDNVKAKLFSIEWQKKKNSAVNIATVTFDRDYNILLAEQRMLNFLSRRYGTFKVMQNKIIFDSVNASEQYTSLYQQLQQSYVVDSANKSPNKR